MNEREEMASYFTLASWQERHELRINETLMRAAQVRAVDMAVRGYFSHREPYGEWPNKLVRKMGYELPTSWPDDANYVESIALGFLTSQAALDAFATSETGHAPHARGQGFFKDHVCFGVGLAEVDDRRIYVLITAPEQTTIVTSHNVFLPYVAQNIA